MASAPRWREAVRSIRNLSHKLLFIILMMYFQTYFLTLWLLAEDNTKVPIISNGSRRKEAKTKNL